MLCACTWYVSLVHEALQGKSFPRKYVARYGGIGEDMGLYHEVLDDSVEARALEVQGLA